MSSVYGLFYWQNNWKKDKKKHSFRVQSLKSNDVD